MTLTAEHLRQLQQARLLLENPSVAARLANVLASPIERGMRMLPEGARDTVLAAATRSLDIALQTALLTLGNEFREASNLAHRISAAVSGGLGGALGLPALAVELPISTTVMLRSISDIARSEGEDLNTREAQLACLEVFALGGTGEADDAAESGYFAVRAALASVVSEAASHVATHGVAREGAPALVRLVHQIATRFSVPVAEKAVAQAAPVIGAAGGALVNTLFISHFQDIARGHFVVRRLERAFGQAQVRAAYLSLADHPINA